MSSLTTDKRSWRDDPINSFEMRVVAVGMTQAQYDQWWIARVKSRCVITESGCWIWQGFKLHNGYGSTSYRSKAVILHRKMFQVAKGITLGRWEYACRWEWQGFLMHFRNQKPGQKGYADSSYRGKKVRVHRKMLEMKLGELLGPKLQACHSCDNPPCINPDHLYPGTNQQNHLDGGKRKRMQGQTKTHCKQGHEFTPENTYWGKRGLSFCRQCKECARARGRQRYWRDPKAFNARKQANERRRRESAQSVTREST